MFCDKNIASMTRRKGSFQYQLLQFHEMSVKSYATKLGVQSYNWEILHTNHANLLRRGVAIYDRDPPKPQASERESCEISFAHDICLSCSIVLKFHTEHGSDTAILCAKFYNDCTTTMCVMAERYFARVVFQMRFDRVSCLRTFYGCFEISRRLRIENGETSWCQLFRLIFS